MSLIHLSRQPHIRQEIIRAFDWLTRWRLPIRMFFLNPPQTELDIAKQMALQGLGTKIQLLDTQWANKFAQFAEIIFCIMATAKQYSRFQEACNSFYAMLRQEECLRTTTLEQVTQTVKLDKPEWQKLYDPFNQKVLVVMHLCWQAFLLGFCCLSVFEAFNATEENKSFFRSQLPANTYFILNQAAQSQKEIKDVLRLIGMEDKAPAINAAITTALKADVWSKKIADVLGQRSKEIGNVLWSNIRGLNILDLT